MDNFLNLDVLTKLKDEQQDISFGDSAVAAPGMPRGPSQVAVQTARPWIHTDAEGREVSQARCGAQVQTAWRGM